VSEAGSPLKAVVFASGGGTNFQALLDHQATDPPWRIELLISDRDTAGALERAGRAGVPSRVIATKDRTPEGVGAEILEALDASEIDVVFLAGYLKLVPVSVVSRYRLRILNIHPALLPSFGGKGMYGMNVHRAVIESGVRVTGATVHLVDEEYDRGTILAQWPVPVCDGDTPEDVAARVLSVEHWLYPVVADHLCSAVRAGGVPTPIDLAGERFQSSESNPSESPEHTEAVR
jgi:phosphoribosylglycinamide formyltransferase-1